MPRVSVVMPVYNAAAYVREAVDSVLAQSYGDFELIAVDDGSTDGSSELLDGYDDPRLRVVHTPNGGEAAARNLGLSHAAGELVAWQDADDVSLPGRLETLVRHLHDDEVGFVHSDMLLIDEAGRPCGYWQAQNLDAARLPGFFLRTGTPFNTPTMLVRREALDGLAYRRMETGIGPDTELVSRFAGRWRGVHVPEPLYLYRRLASSLSASSDPGLRYEHLELILDAQGLEALFPELDWSDGSRAESRARAEALVCLHLYRRGMEDAAQAWLDRAQTAPAGADTAHLVIALAHLALGDAATAAAHLEACERRDHVVENYLGEARALAHDDLGALAHFRRALALRPDYAEPIENLKALGGRTGRDAVDRAWRRFG